jgi:hypothetical protein
MAPQTFVLNVPDAAIAGLKNRLSLTRFPDAAPGEPWAYGSSVEYIRELVAYWKDGFDWRAQEAALNDFPQFKVALHGIDLHYLHVPGVGPNPYPLLLMHGWAPFSNSSILVLAWPIPLGSGTIRGMPSLSLHRRYRDMGFHSGRDRSDL